jgi:hypothetical protein
MRMECRFKSRSTGFTISTLAIFATITATNPGHAVARSTAPPSGLTIMVVGDSVPGQIASRLDAVAQARYGWHVISAAVGGCSIFGEKAAYPNGTVEGGGGCADEVPTTQDAVLATGPDIVLWWDRLSEMPFITADGEFVLSMTSRFWELRRQELDQLVQHLTGSGAKIAFVATEPMGIGVFNRCKTWDQSYFCGHWVRYRMRHYEDLTKPWNHMLRHYVAVRPGIGTYLTITDDVCHEDVSPCDDTLRSGRLARHRGTHYTAGKRRVCRAIIRDLAAALYGS